MLHKKIILFALMLWCFLLLLQFKNVIAAQEAFENGVLVVEGESLKSSEIKFMLADRNVSKIYIYLTHTFYADEYLNLIGIKEFQIFANTWNITQPVVFDISGLDGGRQDAPKTKGSAGNDGIPGMDGANFFGLANRTINGDHLTVISLGGKGGDGQDGSASDDLYVSLQDSADSDTDGWFRNEDFQNYYKNYFDERGYDTEIIGYDAHTSLYAVFVHNKKASLNVRLHPKKCCGTTGTGGLGGDGGRSGKFTFKHVGHSYNTSESIPKVLPFGDGIMGKTGSDAAACETFSLDVRIDAELKQAVVVLLPLHHSISSKFTMLNHTKSLQCFTKYVRNNETLVKSSEPTEIDTASAVIRYKRFLIEEMKNGSVSYDAQKMYKAIDENPEINSENSIRGLLLEASELERNYFDLKNTIGTKLVHLYRRLWRRTKQLRSKTQEDRNARYNLRNILDVKLVDIHKTYDTTLNIEETIKSIERRSYLMPESQNIDDADLQNKINKFMFEVNKNYIVGEYRNAIEKFKMTYFPFSVDYLELEELLLSAIYENLTYIISATTTKLRRLSVIVENIMSTIARITNLDEDNDTEPSNALFIWKGAEIRDKIRDLFDGKKITLLADIKESPKNFNVYKFKSLDLVFRSANQTVNDQLNDVLKAFEIVLHHSGISVFRCNNHIYQLTSEPLFISSSFEKDESQLPLSRSNAYDELRLHQSMLSPYTLWEIELSKYHRRNGVVRDFTELAAWYYH